MSAEAQEQPPTRLDYFRAIKTRIRVLVKAGANKRDLAELVCFLNDLEPRHVDSRELIHWVRDA